MLCEYRAVRIPELKMWATIGTSIGLGMKAPVQGVFVLGSTGLAHAKMLHRRVGAIVRQRLDDTETRAAVGAVGKGVTIASIVQVENLAQAVSTRHYIWKDDGGL